MPFHVMLEAGAQRRAFALNVSEDFLQDRLLGPWTSGEEFVLAGQHWDPRQTRTTIYETTSPVVLDGGAELQTWTLSVLPAGSDRTDELLQRPAGPKGADSAGEATYAEDRRKVMVVLGRNAAAGRAVFEFLRAIDLRPLEWTELVGSVNAGAPYIGEVLDAAFAQAQAVVVLATPDDVTHLRSDLLPEGDPDDEGTRRGQARPNVYFEAGMALGRFPTRTILTELGTLRAASDLGGRHAVRLNNDPACRKDLAQRLEKAGCLVNTSGDAWLTAGDFSAPEPVGGAGRADQATESDPLVARARAMREDLGGRSGFVEIGIADTYNDLVTESGISDMPLAERREPTGHDELMRAPRRAKMTAEEMYTHLGQLITRVTTSSKG
jgi:predicted nucleotide-binding protein